MEMKKETTEAVTIMNKPQIRKGQTTACLNNLHISATSEAQPRKCSTRKNLDFRNLASVLSDVRKTIPEDSLVRRELAQQAGLFEGHC